GFPDSFDDRLGDGGGERTEFVAQCANEIEGITELDSGGDGIGSERQKRGAAHQEVIRAVGLDEANGASAFERGCRESGKTARQLATSESQWCFIEGARAD